MSLFSSVLSSVNNPPPRNSASPAQPTPLSRPSPARGSLNPVAPNKDSAPVASLQPLKRKAEDLSASSLAKVARKDVHLSARTNGTTPPTTHVGISRPVAAPSIGLSSRPSISAVSSSATKAASSTSAAAPAKGSYRDILARAEAAKKAQADAAAAAKAAQIKPVQNLSRKERERMIQEAKAARNKGARGGRTGTLGTNKGLTRTNGAAHSSGSQPLEQTKPKRAPLDLGYKGTMRSANSNSAQAGISKPAQRKITPGAARKERSISARSGSGRYRYASESEEEEEAEEQEEDDDDKVASDAESESMEGGGFDELEMEEMASLRAARKEDALALKEENEHRRLKMEKRKRLEALAAKRRR